MTRVGKAADKGSIEGFVNKLYQFVYARIRNEVFDTLDRLNNRIYCLMDEFNCRGIQKKGLSRYDLFHQEEKPLLRSLPEEPYRFRYRKDFMVSSSYHVPVGSEMHSYSIPYEYVSQKARAVWDMETVEIYVSNKRVAIHKRNFAPYGYTTQDEQCLQTIMEERYERKSIIIASQLPVAKWYDYIGEPAMADAIMDRLISNATHIIELRGESLRKKNRKI